MPIISPQISNSGAVNVPVNICLTGNFTVNNSTTDNYHHLFDDLDIDDFLS